MGKIISFVIRIYQLTISPWIGPCCRFYPSCSEYSIQALKHHGFLYGILFSLKRIIRCNPWCQGGLDPLPEKQKNVDDYA